MLAPRSPYSLHVRGDPGRRLTPMGLSQHLSAPEGSELASLSLEEARPCSQRVEATGRAGVGNKGEKEGGRTAGETEEGPGRKTAEE